MPEEQSPDAVELQSGAKSERAISSLLPPWKEQYHKYAIASGWPEQTGFLDASKDDHRTGPQGAVDRESESE
jgi:hypothetical protein